MEFLTTNSHSRSQYKAIVTHQSRGLWVIDVYIKVSYSGKAYGLDFNAGEYALCGIRHSSNKSKAIKNAKYIVDNNNNPVLPY